MNHKDHYTIQADEWDFRASERSFKNTRELAVAQKRISQKETGAEIFRDLFHALIKAVPLLKKEEEVNSKYSINHKVMNEMLNMEEFQTMRKMSTGDSVGTSIACVHLEPKLDVLFDKLKKLQDVANQLSDKQEELQDAQDEKTSDELIDDLMKEVNELEQSLSDGLDEAGSEVRDTMQEPMKELGEQAEGEQFAKGWGLGAGELARMSHKERIALAKRLSTPEFKRMAEVVGRFQNMATSNVEEVNVNAYDEIYDIEMGNDWSRLLGSEMVAFGEDVLFYEQAKKYLERSLAQYAIRGVETKTKGSIIYCCDGSPSMSGDREVWAKAIGLALLKVAEVQKRKFVAIHFGGPGQYLRMEYDTSGSQIAVTVTRNKNHKFMYRKEGFEAIMEFAELGYQGGGTSYVDPLDEAISIMEEEAGNDAVTSDIIFATDDECMVPRSWEKRFLASKEELGFKMYSFVIGTARVSTMDRISDIVLSPKSLLDGTDLEKIFREL